MIVKCAQCGVELTNNLVELTDPSLLNDELEKQFVPVGYYFIANTGYYNEYIGSIIINTEDLLNAVEHYNAKSGCCGLNDLYGANTMCVNEHIIATWFSDCWVNHAIVFDNNATIRTNQ